MDYLKQRKKSGRRVFSRIIVIALVGLLVVLIRPTWKIFEKSRESEKNLRQAETELAELESRKRKLADGIAYLKTDYGRDQEIRDKFGVVREGETMVVIVRNENEIRPTENAPEPAFFKKIWSGFLGILGLK